MMAAGEDFMQMDSQETAIMMQQDSQETNATIIGRTDNHHENHDQHEGNAAMDDDTSSLADSNTAPAPDSPQAVIASIEALVASILEQLDRKESPLLSSQHVTRRLTLSQSRSFTSICMVLSFSHSLLLSGRTTTTREVYYFFVTHFRSQKECDSAILDACNLLNVPRSSLGLYASPKGWFCGSLEIVRDGTVTDATVLPSVQGLPITREWIDGNDDFEIHSRNAKCILVIEKEGVYNRLSEDGFYDTFPCILVTAKGFPDLASRAMVHRLAQELDLPVYGVCDCNPFGLGVLQTYERGSARMGRDGGDRYSVALKWIGLKPSYLRDALQGQLPRNVYQQLTSVDERRLEKLLEETHPFHNNHELDGDERLQELEIMQSNGYKVELEAMHWLGMDFMGDFLEQVLLDEEAQMERRQERAAREEEEEASFDDSDSDL